MKIELTENPLKELGLALGVGVLAGLAGTTAITLSQLIEMRLTNRPPSKAPVKAVSKVLDMKPTKKRKKEKVAQEIHWTYGTAWGMARGLITLTGLKGWPATLAHFAAITSTAMTLLPKLEIAPPVTEQDPKTIAIDTLHHAVYAVAAGLAYDAITQET
jgi:ATP-dependent protease HslVU (ClpYQ) peptidase subunit